MKIFVSEKEAGIKIWNLFTSQSEDLNKIYNDVDKAIFLNKMQSIWQLSKIITKRSLRNRLRN